MRDEMKRVSNEAVEKATGKTWDAWFTILDEEGARDIPHKDIVRLLSDKGYIDSGWWCQTIAGGYEKARGRRVVGQTIAAGFEIGVRRTFKISAEQAWKVITQPEGMAIWLGHLPQLGLNKGEAYQTTDGTRGEIRSIRPGRSLRLSWQPAHRQKPSTLQVNVVPAGENKSTIAFHQEKLADQSEREQMRRHWQQVLNRLQELTEDTD